MSTFRTLVARVPAPSRLAFTLVLLLTGCLPTPASGGEARLTAEPGTLRAEAAPGESVRLSLRLQHDGGRGDLAVRVTTSAPWLEVASSRVTLTGGAPTDVAVQALCPDVASSQFGWIAFEADTLQAVVSVRLQCAGRSATELVAVAAEAGAEGASEALLRWEPPELVDPVLLRLDPEPTQGLRLDPDRDYVIVFPDTPVRRAINLSGGRNVVIIGGEIDIPWQGNSPSIASRRALHLTRVTGTIHVEGLLLHGDDISEGIQVNAPRAVVQIQNVAIVDIRARDQVDFRDNHPDLIQTYGNARELRVDRFTGSTDYQGFFFQADFYGPAHGPVRLSRVNITGKPTARYLLWFTPVPGAGDVTLEDVWLDVPPERSGGLGRAVWPHVAHDGPSRALLTEGPLPSVSWGPASVPRITGAVFGGRPPGGDFAPPSEVGVGYRSPGYRLAEAPGD
jgi:hypothetical protein